MADNRIETVPVQFNVAKIIAAGMEKYPQVDWDAVVSQPLGDALRGMELGDMGGMPDVPMVDGHLYDSKTKQRRHKS